MRIEREIIKAEKEIIEAIVKAREGAGLTQKQLSEITGIVQPSIAKIENFKRVPTYQTLIKLLVPLGYTLKVVPLNETDN